MTLGEDTRTGEEQNTPRTTTPDGTFAPSGKKEELGDTAVLGLRRIAVTRDADEGPAEVVVPDFLANPKSSAGRAGSEPEPDDSVGAGMDDAPAANAGDKEPEPSAEQEPYSGQASFAGPVAPLFVPEEEDVRTEEPDASGLDVIVDDEVFDWDTDGFEGTTSWYDERKATGPGHTTPPDTSTAFANLPTLDVVESTRDVPTQATGDDEDPWPDRLMWPDETLDERPDEPSVGVLGTAGPADGEGEAGQDLGGVDEGAQEIGAYEDGVAMADAGKRKGWPRLKRVVFAIVAVCAVCGLLVGIHFFGMRQYEGRFLMRTTINGLDVSGCTPAEALNRLEDQTEAYMCTVTVGDYAGAFRGVDFALAREEDRMVQMAWEKVDPRLWAVSAVLGSAYEIDPGLTFDEAVLRDVVMRSVDDHNTMALPVTDAWIRLEEASGLYELGGETSGTAVSKEPVADAVVADVSAFRETSNPDPELVLHEATVNDLPTYAYAVVRANLDRSNDVDILVNGEPVATATVDQLREWVTIDETPAVAVDTQALYEWGEAVVEDAVWHRDDWSNYYLDLDGFVEGFADRLRLGIVEGYEAPTVVALRTEGESRTLAYERGGWNPELGRYIDVDLEAQFVRLFDETGNVIWESACVSGDLYESRSTVTGVFEIYAKQMGTTLVGLDYNNDGKPDYESYVNYWMPFYGGYGLHDATWRSNFGGDFFYYDGSHGCINLPYAKAEELYNITFVGEKVNVHW